MLPRNRSATPTYDGLADMVAARALSKPFLVGIGGSVSVGKTTIVQGMAERLAVLGRSVRVVSTDGFLLSTRVLKERDLTMRKGFPDTYDNEEIERVLSRLRAGEATTLKIYSHDVYDILPDVTERVEPADIVLIEGIIALQQPIVRYLDLAIYIDAPEERIRGWYVDRFAGLAEAAATNPSSFYHRFAGIPLEQIRQLAGQTWDSINSPNLHEHIAASAANAHVIVTKAADHSIAELRTVRAPS